MVVELLHRQDGGELPAEGLCALADRLAGLAADLHIRAAEIDGVVLATCCREPAALPARQWEALEEVLAEMCERTSGALEDLHDRGEASSKRAAPQATPASPCPKATRCDGVSSRPSARSPTSPTPPPTTRAL